MPPADGKCDLLKVDVRCTIVSSPLANRPALALRSADRMGRVPHSLPTCRRTGRLLPSLSGRFSRTESMLRRQRRCFWSSGRCRRPCQACNTCSIAQFMAAKVNSVGSAWVSRHPHDATAHHRPDASLRCGTAVPILHPLCLTCGKPASLCNRCVRHGCQLPCEPPPSHLPHFSSVGHTLGRPTYRRI
jgi:hypothetical protein